MRTILSEICRALIELNKHWVQCVVPARYQMKIVATLLQLERIENRLESILDDKKTNQEIIDIERITIDELIERQLNEVLYGQKHNNTEEESL